MRRLLGLLIFLVALRSQGQAQTCTGLCLQQTTCSAGKTTSISGTVFAPNGTDPLPNVLVFIPNGPVAAFTPGVSCPVIGQPPSGSPLVGTTTGADGTFTLTNVPVGSNIPLVIQSGRWRRQLVVPGTAACADTAFSTRMPRNQGEGDIPKFAITTGSADSVECVLRKVGVDDTEFTNPNASGRIHLYLSSGSPGARVDANTPSADSLIGNLANLNNYDVLMLPCEGRQIDKPATQLANLTQFANVGGRVYTSHFSYVWMYQNPPLSSVAAWDVNQTRLPDGTATVDVTFPGGQTLANWLQFVGATTALGQIDVSTIRHDTDGVIAPTQSWLTLDDPAHNNPVMQFTFNTPVGSTNQCGRVLFNEYHVENPATTPTNRSFPTECAAGPMTDQEKLLEYSLFDLTNNGGEPTLAPASRDFGSQFVGFTTAPGTFLWKNNSVFPANVGSVSATGDFAVASNACTTVASGGTCEIGVVFKPTALGDRTGTLVVAFTGKTTTAALTGRGIADLSISPASLNFGNVDVGATTSKVLTVTNNAPGAIPLGSPVVAGDFSATTTCPATLAAASSCTLTLTFKPTSTGTRSGTVTVASSSAAYVGASADLTGNGVDFTIAVDPTSGTVTAGLGAATSATTSPIAGFAAPVTLSCTTNATASTCVPAATSYIPSSPFKTAVNITTTSKYTVVGYGGSSGAVLPIFAIGSGCLLWLTRRRTGNLVRSVLVMLLLTSAGLSLTGCSGKTPDLNPSFTDVGNYTYTLTATDGFLTHSATYSLKVNVR